MPVLRPSHYKYYFSDLVITNANSQNLVINTVLESISFSGEVTQQLSHLQLAFWSHFASEPTKSSDIVVLYIDQLSNV